MALRKPIATRLEQSPLRAGLARCRPSPIPVLAGPSFLNTSVHHHFKGQGGRGGSCLGRGARRPLQQSRPSRGVRLRCCPALLTALSEPCVLRGGGLCRPLDSHCLRFGDDPEFGDDRKMEKLMKLVLIPHANSVLSECCFVLEMRCSARCQPVSSPRPVRRPWPGKRQRCRRRGLGVVAVRGRAGLA